MSSMCQIFRGSARLVLGAVFGLVLAGTASAGMVSTEDAVHSQQVAKAREQIKTMAQRPELAKKLKAAGVAPEQVDARVNAMTDTEVLALADRLGDLPAGGALSNNDLILILLIVILILVL